MSNFIEFAKENFKVSNCWKGLIPFEVNKFNTDLANLFETERFVLVRKHRVAGFTMFAALWAIHECLTKLDQCIMLVYKTDSEICRYLAHKLRTTIGELPDELRSEIDRQNDHRINFKTGSQIMFTTPEPACGRACNAIIFDEYAFWGNRDTYDKCVWPMVSTGGKWFIASTPNGKKNQFYKYWANENKFQRYTANWKDSPEIWGQLATEEKILETKKNLGEKSWRQEYECEFLDD